MTCQLKWLVIVLCWRLFKDNLYAFYIVTNGISQWRLIWIIEFIFFNFFWMAFQKYVVWIKKNKKNKNAE